MLLIVLEYAILAATFTIAKQTLSFAPPFFLIMTRLMIAGSLLLLLSFLRGRLSWAHIWADRSLFFAAGLFHAFFAFVPEFWALQHMTSAKTSIIYGMTPFVAAILSYFLYAERLQARQWVGMVIGALGLVPLIVLQAEPAGLLSLWQISLPEFVLFGSMTSACYAWFVIKKLMGKGYSIPLINGVAMLLGGMMTVPTVLYAEPQALSQVGSWSSFAGWLSLLIILSHFVSYNLYSWLLTRYTITFMTFCGFLCPLFSTVFGAQFLGELITWHYIVALLCITLGLTVFTSAEAQK